MNSTTIYLSSNSSSHIETSDMIYLNDHTKVNIDLSSIFSKIIPIFIKIDWGYGDIETIDNDLYEFPDRENVNIFNRNTLLNTIYSYNYYPSSTSLYKELFLQVLIMYSNTEYSWFVVPISIKTDDFFESIYDLNLKNVNILPKTNNPKEYQLIASKTTQLVELRGDD